MASLIKQLQQIDSIEEDRNIWLVRRTPYISNLILPFALVEAFRGCTTMDFEACPWRCETSLFSATYGDIEERDQSHNAHSSIIPPSQSMFGSCYSTNYDRYSSKGVKTNSDVGCACDTMWKRPTITRTVTNYRRRWYNLYECGILYSCFIFVIQLWSSRNMKDHSSFWSFFLSLAHEVISC